MNNYVVMSDPLHRVLNLTEVDGHNIYVIKRTISPLGYHHNGFISAKCNLCTWAHKNRKSCTQELKLPQCYCGYNWEGTLFS